MNLTTVKVGDITEWPDAAQIAAADRAELRLWLNGLPLPKTNGHCATLRAICERLATFNGADKQPKTLPMPQEVVRTLRVRESQETAPAGCTCNQPDSRHHDDCPIKNRVAGATLKPSTKNQEQSAPQPPPLTNLDFLAQLRAG